MSASEFESLVNFVQDLNDNFLERLLVDLQKKPKSYAVYYSRTKEDWKEYYGISGVDIYNHLHPQQGNFI